VNEPYVNTAEAARFLGLAKSTLDSLRVRGGGPSFHKFGRAVRYHLSDLQQYAEQTRRLTTSQIDTSPLQSSTHSPAFHGAECRR
jgi:excisionase family DNA binding protein